MSTKAILVINMPSRCGAVCPLCDVELRSCNVNYKPIPSPNERPSWCPLIPLNKDACRIAFDDEDETVVYIRTYKNAHDNVVGEVF